MSDEPVAELSGAQFLPPAGRRRARAPRPRARRRRLARGCKSYRFVTRQPSLSRQLRRRPLRHAHAQDGGYELTFHVQPGSEGFIEPYAQLVGEALQFYTQKYGQPAFGTRISVVQIDDASLDAYAAPGVQFLSPRFFTPGRQASLDARLLREVGYQWWGLTVGLKSFDDAWLSQGSPSGAASPSARRALTGGRSTRRSATCLSARSCSSRRPPIARAPSTLDDQSAAYQAVVFYKGAMVFRMLRETIRPGKFDELMKRYFGVPRPQRLD
jgi:aminopeptidase N